MGDEDIAGGACGLLRADDFDIGDFLLPLPLGVATTEFFLLTTLPLLDPECTGVAGGAFSVLEN